MDIEEIFLASTKQTPGGRAFYPAGTWGAGYLLDTKSQQAIKIFLGRYVWIMIIGLMPLLPLTAHHPLFLLLGYAAVISALRYLVLRYILRHRPRTSVRLTYNDVLGAQSRLVSLEATAYRLSAGALLMLLFAVASCFLFDVTGLEGRTYVILCFGSVAYLAFQAYRVARKAQCDRLGA